MSTGSNSVNPSGKVIFRPAQHSSLARQKHAPATILLHWGTVIAIVIAVTAIYLRETTEDKWLRQSLLDLHRQLGLLVLCGLALRLAVRYAKGLADHAGQLPAILRCAALLTHLALYLMLLAIPLLGWAASSAHDVKLNLFGLIPLPALVRPDADFADTLDDYHKWAAWALGGLVLMHASAALWHHYFRKDGVLFAMLPTRRARSPSN
jgi:cytochrome b561